MSSGDRIWTYDLRVMSPTSFQTAPPRGTIELWKLQIRRFQMDGEGFEPSNASPADLQSVPFGHSGIHPQNMMLYASKPMSGLEPLTCWLQISCSANWATSAHYTLFKILCRLIIMLICNQLLCLQLIKSIVRNWATSAHYKLFKTLGRFITKTF